MANVLVIWTMTMYTCTLYHVASQGGGAGCLVSLSLVATRTGDSPPSTAVGRFLAMAQWPRNIAAEQLCRLPCVVEEGG